MNVVPLPQPESDPITFDDFWLLYPRRVAKKDARRAWARIPAAQHMAILEALVAWRPVWRDKDPQYLPHAATWLNGERWEDELPEQYRARHLSHLPVEPSAQSERSIMPDKVRQMLAKLRGKG